MTVGIKDTPKAPFRMHVIALPANLAEGFKYDRKGKQQSSWHQKELLPDERIVHSLTVVRDDKLDNCGTQ
jgi:hypothetical protein